MPGLSTRPSRAVHVDEEAELARQLGTLSCACCLDAGRSGHDSRRCPAGTCHRHSRRTLVDQRSRAVLHGQGSTAAICGAGRTAGSGSPSREAVNDGGEGRLQRRRARARAPCPRWAENEWPRRGRCPHCRDGAPPSCGRGSRRRLPPRHRASARRTVQPPAALHQIGVQTLFCLVRMTALVGGEAMREVQATKAKAHFAELLRTVEYGETVAITRHGRAIAHLTPVRDQEVARRREAVYRFRSGRRRWRRIEMSTDEVLAARREGHRW